MKTILYYFSGTGNTFMLARLLAKKLDDVEIINIVSCNDDTPAPKADAIGILFPVYAFGLPKIVHNFVENNLKINDGTYVFALTNYGGVGGPAALKQLKTILKERDIKLNAGFGIPMPANYIPFGGAESQQKQNRRFLAAAEKIDKIAQTIKKRLENYFYKKTCIFCFIANIFYKIFIKKCSMDAKKFYVNDNCKGCATCEKVCPTNNIKMVDNRPVWGNNCEQCMACLQWCPSVAIHRKGTPENRLHYQNPGIDVEDLIKDMHRNE
jgi:ferredoxin/flavodoxin